MVYIVVWGYSDGEAWHQVQQDVQWTKKDCNAMQWSNRYIILTEDKYFDLKTGGSDGAEACNRNHVEFY